MFPVPEWKPRNRPPAKASNAFAGAHDGLKDFAVIVLIWFRLPIQPSHEKVLFTYAV